MALIHRLLFHAAQRLVTDPRVREKAAELIETEVKPRVRDTWQQVKPRIDATKSDLAQIASETDCPFYKLRPAQKPWYFECPSHWLGWLHPRTSR